MKLVSLHWWLHASGEGRLTGTDVFEIADDRDVDDFLGEEILNHLSDLKDKSYFTKFEMATLSGYAIRDFGVVNTREIKSTKRKIHRINL